MQRFFVLPTAIRGQQVHFSAEQSHQMRHVLRLRSDDEVWVLDGEGWRHRVAVQHVGKSDTLGRILDTAPAAGEPGGDFILCQAIARGERFEWVLQKGVELGVTHFQPMITRRTVHRSPGESQRQRWERIVREAAEQCGRGRLPQLLPEISFEEAITHHRGIALLPSTAAARPVRQALATAAWPITAFIGPEGGFDPTEIAFARAAGIEPISLGPRTLRTETAAIVLISLVMAALGELDHPAPRADDVTFDAP